jgi:hypothetical protein
MYASLPHVMVLSDSSKSPSVVPLPEVLCDASQTNLKGCLHWFRKSVDAKLDMHFMLGADAHPLPCNKTPSLVENLEINNPTILIWMEQANSTNENMIIDEPREHRKEIRNQNTALLMKFLNKFYNHANIP